MLLDELWDLVMNDDSGFIVKLRLWSEFDEIKYHRIIEILSVLVSKWKGEELIPRKLFLITMELLQHTIGGNNYMSESELIKLENASIKILDILSDLYHKEE